MPVLKRRKVAEGISGDQRTRKGRTDLVPPKSNLCKATLACPRAEPKNGDLQVLSGIAKELCDRYANKKSNTVINVMTKKTNEGG